MFTQPLRIREAPDGRPVAPWLWCLAGFVASIMLAVSPLVGMPGLLEIGAPWYRLLLTLPAHLVMLLAWWQLGPRWWHPRWTAAAWSVPLLFTLPLHSRDAYAYAAAGWMVNNGVDPYTTPLGQAGEPGLLVGTHWDQTTSVYPSLSLDLFGLIARITNSDTYWTTVGLRLPSVLALVILAFVLPALARRAGINERLVLWAGLFNPIMLVQWIGGVHNDALMVALGILAILAVFDLGWGGWRGLLLAGISLGLAMGIKQSAALYGLGVVAVAWALRYPTRKGWWSLVATAVVPGAITVGTFVLTELHRGFGWRNETAGNPIEVTSNAPLSWLAAFIRSSGVTTDEVANGSVFLLSAMMVGVLIVLAWVRFGPKGRDIGRPWLFAVLVPALFCLTTPALQPWYLTWLLPLYPFVNVGPRWHRLWLVAVVAFSVLPAFQERMAAYVSMLLLAVPLWLFWRRLAKNDVSPLPAWSLGPGSGVIKTGV